MRANAGRFTVRHRVFGMLATAGALGALVALSVPVAGQGGVGAPAAPASTRPIPRLSNGKPDLTGIWAKNTLNTPVAGVPAGARVDSLGGSMLAEGVRTRPLTPFGRWRYNQRLHEVNPQVWCWPPGVPRIDWQEPYPVEFLQRPDRLIMAYEFSHNFRVAPTDGRQHPADLAPTYLGHSVGYWEGDTLVLDVRGFTDNTWLDIYGNPHSGQMRVVERFTRTAYDQLEFQFTIEDPTIYTRPWTSTKRVWPLARPEWNVMEYSCTSFNRVLTDSGGGFAAAGNAPGRDVLEEAAPQGAGPGRGR